MNLFVETLGQGRTWSCCTAGAAWRRVRPRGRATGDAFLRPPGGSAGPRRVAGAAALRRRRGGRSARRPFPLARPGGGLVAWWPDRPALGRPPSGQGEEPGAGGHQPRFVRDETWPHAQARASIEAVAQSLDGAFEQTLERFLALQMMGAPSARDTLKALRGELFSHGRPQGLLPALGCCWRPTRARWPAASSARPRCSTARATPSPRSAPAAGWPSRCPTPSFTNSRKRRTPPSCRMNRISCARLPSIWKPRHE
ncbi:pimelyl-[acyl-carrier protein] methyl ester esterase [Chromobacterium violaceum]|uniref:Pimelyl-[acyl-carrier protein] methyl ester esterase n=1 Tax=Chromobacterium violaceum TaxID=536 RepID=A0A3S4LMF0_CHRVL|nr:pimelyl-[acyl-carrier protein] methyl ester esterase [Chromobacterium violaceum]